MGDTQPISRESNNDRVSHAGSTRLVKGQCAALWTGQWPVPGRALGDCRCSEPERDRWRVLDGRCVRRPAASCWIGPSPASSMFAMASAHGTSSNGSTVVSAGSPSLIAHVFVSPWPRDDRLSETAALPSIGSVSRREDLAGGDRCLHIAVTRRPALVTDIARPTMAGSRPVTRSSSTATASSRTPTAGRAFTSPRHARSSAPAEDVIDQVRPHPFPAGPAGLRRRPPSFGSHRFSAHPRSSARDARELRGIP